MTERFFFVHLQKTAGTALFQRLRDNFGAGGVYPTPDEQGDVRGVIDMDYLVDHFAAHRDDIRVVTGHFPLCATEMLGVPFTTFTLLRHPVERTLSVLRRRKQAEERFRDLELDAIYTDPELQDITRNHMVKMLSMNADEMTPVPLVQPVDFDDVHLERAKNNLEARVDVFGLQEHFDEFCADLTNRYGWDLGEPRFANRTERRPVRDALREQIAYDNQMDMKLYEFAAALWDERRRETAGR